jgi:predicted  nucleic acid-binding Zn-ribbon protein
MSDLERLHQLQLVDSSLDQLAYRRNHLYERKQFDASRAGSAAARAALDANVARRAELDAEYARMEASGREIDKKVTRLEGQMRNVVVTREAEAIQREIATLRAERDRGDEAGLGLLDESETLSAAVPSLEATIASCAETEAACAATLRSTEEELDAQVQALRAERDQHATALPAALVARYEQLRPTFKGVAVARLQGTRCTGCHLDLSRVEIEAVRAVPAGEIPECPQCARLLAP